MIVHSIPFIFFCIACIAFFWAAIGVWCRLRASYATLTAQKADSQFVLQADAPPACYHLHVEPVIPSGETEPVAALCADCLAEVPLARWRKQEAGWQTLEQIQAGRTVLDDADAAIQRTTLGLHQPSGGRTIVIHEKPEDSMRFHGELNGWREGRDCPDCGPVEMRAIGSANAIRRHVTKPCWRCR